MAAVAPAHTDAGRLAHVGEILRGRRGLELGGALLTLIGAILLYTRYSILGVLSRDQAIYAYGGERMAHGTPPYASIFDPKGPGATILSGISAGIGRLTGRNELYLIRLAFFVCAVLTVVAVYVLVLRLGSSIVAALGAAAVFASFESFARDALPGPDAKVPGILALVLAMWLASRRNWFLSGLVGMVAFLVWQPLFVYPLIAVVAAYLTETDRRLRAAGRAATGAAVPFVAVCSYFLATGAFGKFLEAAFRFPLEGVRRGNETVGQRLMHIGWVVHHYNGGVGAYLFWLGLVGLAGVAAGSVGWARAGRRAALLQPLVLIVVFTGLVQWGYAASDFQSYPDLYSLLPYPAVGFGVALALGVRSLRRPAMLRVCVSCMLALAVALLAYSWVQFTDSKADNRRLDAQWAAGCAVNRIVVPGTPMYAIGDPTPLVMTHRTNPDRYIYLGSGVIGWKLKRLDGGFAGWENEIRASRASVIVLGGWTGPMRQLLGTWLAAHYVRGYVGTWRVFLTPQARQRMPSAGIGLTPFRTDWPHTAGGLRFTRQKCGNS
jgi:hypothetical protein